MRWPLQPLQPLQQTQLQPLFGQSVDSLCHPWFTTTNVSYRFPILKLPPPPCAVLLVTISSSSSSSNQIKVYHDLVSDAAPAPWKPMGIPWGSHGIRALEVAEISCTSTNCSATAGLVSPPAQHSPGTPWLGHGFFLPKRGFQSPKIDKHRGW